MDLHNNVIGRLLGQHLGSAGFNPPRNAMALCVESWNWQYLWRIGGDGRIHWSNGGSIVPNPPYKWLP